MRADCVFRRMLLSAIFVFTFTSDSSRADDVADSIKLLQSAKKFQSFADSVANLKVTDAFTDRRKRLRDTAQEKAAAAQNAALEATRV